MVQQGGDQSVAVADLAAVRAGHGQVGFDDPHTQRVQVGQVGAVRKVVQHGRVAGGFEASQQLRPAGGDLGEEGAAVEASVQ